MNIRSFATAFFCNQNYRFPYDTVKTNLGGAKQCVETVVAEAITPACGLS